MRIITAAAIVLALCASTAIARSGSAQTGAAPLGGPVAGTTTSPSTAATQSSGTVDTHPNVNPSVGPTYTGPTNNAPRDRNGSTNNYRSNLPPTSDPIHAPGGPIGASNNHYQ